MVCATAASDKPLGMQASPCATAAHTIASDTQTAGIHTSTSRKTGISPLACCFIATLMLILGICLGSTLPIFGTLHALTTNLPALAGVSTFFEKPSPAHGKDAPITGSASAFLPIPSTVPTTKATASHSTTEATLPVTATSQAVSQAIPQPSGPDVARPALANPPAPEAPLAQSAVVLPPMPAEWAKKIADTESATRRRPASPDLWVALGNLYFDTSQAEKAVAAYSQSLRLRPAAPDVLTDRGIMLRELGRFDDAVTDFRAASALNARHENALFNEGCVLYYDLKQRDKAIQAWKRLLAINPAARAPDGRSVAELLKHLY